jgi:hypothetical protein
MRRKPALPRRRRPQRDGAAPIDMETVALIETELGDDLIVSFAIEDPTDRIEIQCLTLVRTPRFEALVPPEERGVGVSFDRYLDDDDRRDLLEEVRFSENEKTVHLETSFHWYDLDVSKVDEKELLEMRKVFRKMNRDGRFRCEGV